MGDIQMDMAGGRRVAVVGAGPVGCAAAEIMASRGFGVDLYERREVKPGSADHEGRTINLSLSPRGMRTLDRLGVGDAVRARSVPMVARAFHPRAGGLVVQPYGAPEHRTFSIARDELNRLLLEHALLRPEVRLHDRHLCYELDVFSNHLVFKCPDGQIDAVDADVVVGADGVASEVRTALIRAPRVDFTKLAFAGGYRELTVLARDGDYAFRGDAIHIWPRGDFFMVALPNLDKRLRATLVLPDARLAALDTPDALAAFLREQLPDAAPHLAESADQLLLRPVGDIVTVRVGACHWRDRVVLLGDAAHSVVPFMGQGVNLGLEDCAVFADLLDEQQGDLGSVFAELTRRRVPEGLACADLSMSNFRELVSGDGVEVPSGETAAASVVARVNFVEQSYQSVARQTLANWAPRVGAA
jgi:kynurenine 3-monooxygenase